MRTIAKPAPFLAAGRRDCLVTIQARPAEDAADTSGFPAGEWTPLSTAWMAREEFDGDERFTDAQIAPVQYTRWFSDARADLDPDQVLDVEKVRRLVYRGRVYDILHVAPVEPRKGVVILSRKGGVAA